VAGRVCQHNRPGRHARPICLKPMSEKIAEGSARSRTSQRAMAERITAAFEAGDIVDICHAIGTAARQHNLADLARRAGIESTSLYRAFAGGEKRPNFSTVLNVLHAMGLELHVTIRQNAKPMSPHGREPGAPGAFDPATSLPVEPEAPELLCERTPRCPRQNRV